MMVVEGTRLPRWDSTGTTGAGPCGQQHWQQTMIAMIARKCLSISKLKMSHKLCSAWGKLPVRPPPNAIPNVQLLLPRQQRRPISRAPGLHHVRAKLSVGKLALSKGRRAPGKHGLTRAEPEDWERNSRQIDHSQRDSIRQWASQAGHDQRSHGQRSQRRHGQSQPSHFHGSRGALPINEHLQDTMFHGQPHLGEQKPRERNRGESSWSWFIS